MYWSITTTNQTQVVYHRKNEKIHYYKIFVLRFVNSMKIIDYFNEPHTYPLKTNQQYEQPLMYAS